MGRDLAAELLEVGQIALESSKEYCGGLLDRDRGALQVQDNIDDRNLACLQTTHAQVILEGFKGLFI